MEPEDKYQHPDFRGLTKTGKKRPNYKDKSSAGYAVRRARFMYIQKRNAAKTVDERRLAWEEYCHARDLYNFIKKVP